MQRGPVFQQITVRMDAGDSVRVTFRLVRGQAHVGLEAEAGPLDVSDRHSKDVFVRITTDIDNDSTFYSDENGMEMKQRRINSRAWAPLYADPAYPVASNFYPMTAIAGFGDAQTHISVLSQNSHAVGSTSSGSLDVMYHRIWFKDGKVEPPDTPVRARFTLLVGPPATVEDVRRPLSWQLLNPRVLATSSAALPTPGPAASLLTTALPAELHVLSLQQLPANLSQVLDGQAAAAPAKLVLRIAHIFPRAGSTHGPATLQLAGLFRHLSVTSVEELTADGVAPLAAAQAQRLHWQTQTSRSRQAVPQDAAQPEGRDTTVTLQSMDLRTFHLIVNAE